MKKRILSVLAVLTVLLCVLPVAALASGETVAATITHGGVQTQYETLQEALDAACDGDVIQLTAGELGAGALRQTEKSDNSAESGPMHLHRSLTDVTIRGAEGSEKTVIDGLDIATGHIYGEGTHPVNGQPLNGTANSYYSYWEISNLTLENIHFTKSVYIGADSAPFCEIDGFTIRNCSYTGTDSSVNNLRNKLLHVGNTTNPLKNFVIENCAVQTAFQGVYVQAVDGITVRESSFDGLGHNAVAVQDGTLGGPPCPSKGQIVIENNDIANGNDRAIRFGHIGAGSVVTISGNSFTDVEDDGGELIKAGGLAADAAVSVQGNTWTVGGEAKSEEEIFDAIVDLFLAEVNGTRYASLTGALEAAVREAEAGRTVELVLLADVTGTEGQYIGIPEGMTVTLDLNGYRLIGVNQDAFIKNQGDLTINDSSAAKTGAIYTTNVEDQGRHAVENYGVLTINGGTFGDENTDRTDANLVQRGNALRNFGTATINGGFFTACDNYVNGGYAYAIANGGGSGEAVMTINNATVYGRMNGAIASDGGVLTVNGGTYTLGNGGAGTSYRMVYTSGEGSVVIRGGVFTRNVPNNNAFFGNGGTGTIQIEGGTFENKVTSGGKTDISADLSGPVEISGGNFKDKLSAATGTPVKVSGGIFAAAVEESLCAEGFEPVDNGSGSYGVVAESAPAVAKINDQEYKTLLAAVNAVQPGETILLLADVHNADRSNVLDVKLPGGAVLDGKDPETGENHILSGNITVHFDKSGGTVQNVVFQDINNIQNKLSAIYASRLTGEISVTGCTFDNVDWDAIQITPEAGSRIVIRGNSFRDSDPAVRQQRFIHIEAPKNNGGAYYSENVSVTVTDNVMDTDNLNNAAMGIYYLEKDDEELDFTGNYLSDPNYASIALGPLGDTVNATDMIFPARSQADIDEDDLAPAAAVVIDQWNMAFYDTLQEAVAAAGAGGVVRDLKVPVGTGTLTVTLKTGYSADIVYEQRAAGDSFDLPVPSRAGYSFKGWQDGDGQIYSGGAAYTVGDADAVLTAQWSANTPGGVVVTYPISIQEMQNGSVTVSVNRAAAGTLVEITAIPLENYWLSEITVTGADGKAIEATEADGKYRFVMPAGAVAIDAAFATNPFSDVDKDDWFYDDVMYVFRSGVMEGTGGDRFEPDLLLTRAMIVQMLWNMEGNPAGSPKASFTDLASGAWYTDAVDWAAAEGIVLGYGDGSGRFGPDDLITREQMVLIFCRYAALRQCDTSARTDLAAYKDADEIAPYAEDAMEWAVASGLIEGRGGMALEPKGEAMRSEAAALIRRYAEKILK